MGLRAREWEFSRHTHREPGPEVDDGEVSFLSSDDDETPLWGAVRATRRRGHGGGQAWGGGVEHGTAYGFAAEQHATGVARESRGIAKNRDTVSSESCPTCWVGTRLSAMGAMGCCSSFPSQVAALQERALRAV